MDWCNILQTECISYDILQEICQIVYIAKQLNYYCFCNLLVSEKCFSMHIQCKYILWCAWYLFVLPQILLERINLKSLGAGSQKIWKELSKIRLLLPGGRLSFNLIIIITYFNIMYIFLFTFQSFFRYDCWDVADVRQTFYNVYNLYDLFTMSTIYTIYLQMSTIYMIYLQMSQAKQFWIF